MINEIIEEYRRQKYILTLRQLYYQLVTRDVIPNKSSEYSKLSTLLKEGRMGGIVDWDAIEDRLRKPSQPASWDTPADAMDSLIAQYKKPRMFGQDNYIEVWVEKDALSGVLKRVTEPYHIPILVNRGYSSASAMYDSYRRFESALGRKQKVTVLYLGDFDPSGIDMIRDIKDRISEFLIASKYIANKFSQLYDDLDEHEDIIYEYRDLAQERLAVTKGYNEDDYPDMMETVAARLYAQDFVKKNYDVIPIALTRKQITQYNPPPNPAKTTDPRSGDFIDKHGTKSWEVDALKPEILNEILTTNILKLIDEDKYNRIIREEAADIQRLEELKGEL